MHSIQMKNVFEMYNNHYRVSIMQYIQLNYALLTKFKFRRNSMDEIGISVHIIF